MKQRGCIEIPDDLNFCKIPLCTLTAMYPCASPDDKRIYCSHHYEAALEAQRTPEQKAHRDDLRRRAQELADTAQPMKNFRRWKHAKPTDDALSTPTSLPLSVDSFELV